MPTTAIAAAANQGITSVSSSRSLPAKSGRKTSGPRAAPNSAPKRTYEIARAFRRVHIRRGRSREQHRAVHRPHPEEAEDHERRAVDRAAESGQHAAERAHAEAPRDDGNPPEPVHQPSAGSAASAPAVMKIAGPRPRIDSIPVTRTSVIVATATASWSTPERSRRQSESRTVLRRTGCEMAVIEQFNQPRPELLRAAV